MSHGNDIEKLVAEFERVGIDPNTVSAGLAVPSEELLRALQQLPDKAGPIAFLHQLRVVNDETHAAETESA